MGNSGACAIFEIQVQSDQTRGGESIVGRYRSIPRYQSARREVFANNGCLYRDCAEPARRLKWRLGDQAARFSHANLPASLIRMFGAGARTRRMNDRRNSQPRDVLSFGPFSLFPAERLLKKADKPIALGGRALDILIALVERAGEVVTYKELTSAVWPDVVVEKGNLRFQMATLRKALGDGLDGARYVSNVSGRGYCLVAPVTRSTAARTVPVTRTATAERVQRLPPRPARMVGRDDTVRELARQLQVWRFVCIVGPGGIGKTTVAISVAHTLIGGFHDAVFFIDLAVLTDPQLVPTVVASALGFMVQTQDPLVSLLAFIGDKKILLVLDNCEHVIGVAAGWPNASSARRHKLIS